jgi:hypothetical protein
MVEELSHQHISIPTGLRKQQSPRGKTIDAMHHQRSLPLQFEFCDKERQSGQSIGALNRHCQKSGRFVENDHGIVFVEDGKFPGETRPASVFMGRNPIPLFPMAARLSRMFLHWLGADDHRHYQTIPPTSQTRRPRLRSLLKASDSVDVVESFAWPSNG